MYSALWIRSACFNYFNKCTFSKERVLLRICPRLAVSASEARHRGHQYSVGRSMFLQTLLWDRTYKLCYNSLWLSIAKHWKIIVLFSIVFLNICIFKIIMYVKLYNIVTIIIKLTHHGTQCLQREWRLILISLILYLLKLCIFIICNK